MASEIREDAVAVYSVEPELADVPTTDNSLVREFIGGNDAAFTQLVSRYKDSLKDPQPSFIHMSSAVEHVTRSPNH